MKSVNEVLNLIKDMQKQDAIDYLISLLKTDEFENIEDIGWCYQYYIEAEKKQVFDGFKYNKKASSKDIPIATQIFTPRWIVEFMVDNSLKQKFKEKDIKEITFIDPCCGTGHILLYAYEVFFNEYIKDGYSIEEANKSIFEKNLYGVDIDENVVRISTEALKAKSKYDGKINVVALKNEFGSLEKNGELLNCKYDVVCTNPPYMGRKNLNEKLKKYLEQNYPNNKSELYTAFIERCMDFTKENGYLAMITIHTWMFISSYEDLRECIISEGHIEKMCHTGAATFTDLSSFNALSTILVWKKCQTQDKSCFIRLADYYNPDEKIKNINNKKNYYYINQDDFLNLPGKAFIYWLSNDLINAIKNNKRFGDFFKTKQGLATGNNKEFVKYWWEVPPEEINWNAKSIEDFHKSGKKYAPYNKGGIYRKWYGNYDYVIKFDEASFEMLKNQGNHLPSRDYYFQRGIVWSLFGFENFGVRFKDTGYVFDVSGASCFTDEKDLYYVLGYLASNVAFKFLSSIAPTVNFQVGNIASLPFKFGGNREKINSLVKENIKICKEEWSFYQTSREFTSHPFEHKKFRKETLKNTLNNFKLYYNDIRNKLKKNEEELNKEFNKIFDVNVDFHVNDRDLTIKPFDEKYFVQTYIVYKNGKLNKAEKDFVQIVLDKAFDKYMEKDYEAFKSKIYQKHVNIQS